MDLSLEHSNELWNQARITIQNMINTHLTGIEREVAKRGYRVANQTRNELIKLMQGNRSGRRYKVPMTHGGSASGVYYNASAPNEVPAVRTGALRLSYGAKLTVNQEVGGYTVRAGVESNLRSGNYLIGELLEEGTSKMAPRPYRQAVIDKVTPYAQRIYGEPYNL